MTGILVGDTLPTRTISHTADVVNQLNEVIKGAAEQMKEFTAAGVLICHNRSPFEQICKNMMMVLRLKRLNK